MNYLVTIIILHYNQNYEIAKLIKSIPDIENVEIIIIDDGSNDKNINIFNKKNVKIIYNNINTKNQSYCRNLGIKNANGKYILFMDSDDEYNTKNFCDFLLYLNNTDYDIIFLSSLHKTINNNEYILYFHNNVDLELSHCITRYCVKKSFLLKNNIWFDELKYNYDSEDAYFFYQLLNYLNNYTIYDKNKPLTIIYQRKGNNTYTKFKNPNYKNYLYELCRDLNKICKNNKNIKYFLRNYYLEELKRIKKFNENEKEHENF